MKSYIKYHIRWQMGFVIFSPCMYLFNYWHIDTWVSIILMQFVGAIIFWPLDKYIFKKKEPIVIKNSCANCGKEVDINVCGDCFVKELTKIATT